MRRLKERAKFWRTVPPMPTALFLAGVFCLFGTVGILSTAFNPGVASPLWTMSVVLISGGFAAGYAFATTRNIPKIILILIPCQIAAIYLLIKNVPRTASFNIPQALNRIIVLENVGAMVLVVGGYTLFIAFVQLEGKRYFKAHTEIKLATDIHRALVPSLAMHIGGFELLGVSQPSGDVGGDLVDVIQEGGRWFGYVADVSGHGVPAGVLMAMVKSAVRMHWAQGLNAASLMNRLNSVVSALRLQDMFVTCGYLQCDGGASLRFSLAGHLPILHFNAATGSVVEHSVVNYPLGLFPQAEFETSELQCSPGDVMLILTDGLTEVFDKNEMELGLEGLKRILRDSAAQPLEQIWQSLRNAALRHGPQSDDQTMLVVRHLSATRESAG